MLIYHSDVNVDNNRPRCPPVIILFVKGMYQLLSMSHDPLDNILVI